MKYRSLFVLSLLALPLCPGPATAEEQCGLKRVAELAATTDTGDLLIKIQVDGHDATALMDTGSPVEMISPQLAAELKLTPISVREGALVDFAGKSARHMVRVHKVGLGGMTANDVPFVLFGENESKAPAFDAIFGSNFLEAYDVELDLAHHKVNLYLPDHCPGQVVYWTTNYDVLPFRTDASGHAVLHVTLDGQSLLATLDTGASASVLSLQTARHLFNFDPSASDVKPDGNMAGGTGSTLPYYRHRFSALEIGGVAFHNTELFIMPDKLSQFAREHNPVGPSADFEQNMETHVTIGLHHLSRVRAYLAFREQKLYISAADAN
jgi:predicted aspartyl protease